MTAFACGAGFAVAMFVAFVFVVSAARMAGR
jgi:hypothetical protein